MLTAVVGSLLGVGALLAPVALASPAAAEQGGANHADSNAADAPRQPSAKTPHCAVTLTPEGNGATSSPEQRCFERFADAVEYSTNGDVQLPGDAGPRALDLDSKGVAGSTLLGVLYNKTGYGGGSKVLNGTGKGCYAGRTYTVKNLDELGFEDRANSFKVRSNCMGRVHADRNLEGAKYLCEDNCPSLGNMNNRTSSVKFF